MSLAEWFEKRKRENPEWEAEIDARIDDLIRDTFDADFNDADDHHGRVAVLVPEDKPIPELGRVIHLYDAEGNYCGGVVREIQDRLLFVECDWDTWWPGKPIPPDECPDQAKHRNPEGPNEDMGLCRLCRWPTFEMRPEGETYGDHWPDCSLPIRHERECVGGGAGHPRARKIRGYWPGQVAGRRGMRDA